MNCTKCQKEGSPPDFVPYEGELLKAILSQICSNCWDEWKTQSVIVINEGRLTLFLPEHQKFLEAEMKKFLGLTL